MFVSQNLNFPGLAGASYLQMNDLHWVSEAALMSVAQRWPLGIQIDDEIDKISKRKSQPAAVK